MNGGQVGYEEYARSTGGKTWDGRDMPTWAQVCERTPHVAKAWDAAASAISQTLFVRSTRTSDLSFGDALKHLREGHRVAREGWNGKGMWIALTPGSVIDGKSATSVAARGAARDHALACVDAQEWAPSQVRIGAHIDMKAADGSLAIGWHPSQLDMLAEDWTVLE